MITQSITRALLVQLCPCPGLGTTESAEARLAEMDRVISLKYIIRRLAVPEKVSAPPVCLTTSIPSPHHAVIQSRRKAASASLNRGVSAMQIFHVQNPSANMSEVAMHRTMAIVALRANASMSARLARYNNHMAIARSLALTVAPNEDLETPELCPPSTGQDTGGRA